MARRRRVFDATFKAEVVMEWITGRTTQAELCRKHQLSPNLLASWKATLLSGLPRLFESDEKRSEDQRRIEELEGILGRKTMELEILKKASNLLNGGPRRSET